jgi:hypothetical protein
MRQHPENGFVFCGAGIAAYLRGDAAAGVALLEKGVELSGSRRRAGWQPAPATLPF